MYCENCGHKVPENARFCPNCGHNLKNDFPSKVTNFKNQWNQWSDAKRALSILAICLIGLLIVNGISVVKLMSDIDEQVVDNDDTYSSVSYDDSDDDTYATTVVEDNPTSTESSSSSDSSSDDSYSQSSSDNYESSSGGSYVGSVNSNKFHYPSCGQAGKIKSGNLVTFSSREDAISRGYYPCKFCNP